VKKKPLSTLMDSASDISDKEAAEIDSAHVRFFLAAVTAVGAIHSMSAILAGHLIICFNTDGSMIQHADTLLSSVMSKVS